VYRVQTKRQGDVVHQAVFDLAYQRDDNRALLLTLMVAGAAGLMGAAAVGAALSRRAISPLEEALDRQRRFVTDASHELRAPLTRLHTRAQLILQRSTGLPESVAAELQRMVTDTRELGEVIDDLLRSARLRAGPPVEIVDLGTVAADLIAAETGRLEERGLDARLQVGTERVVVPGIESSLRRMLSALIDNAIGHSRPGGRIVVSLDRVEHGRAVELVVADDGVGLDPDCDRSIFERFVRGTSGAGQRHGIGLALAREVVESHGGTIDATGEPGSGARFVVRLPAARPSDPWAIARLG
jgi:two-component system OmpR family sensor kinase